MFVQNKVVCAILANLNFVAGTGGFVNSVENLHKHYTVLHRGDTFGVALTAVNEVIDLAGEQSVEIKRGVAEGLDINKNSVHITEEFYLRVDLRARLSTEELDLSAVIVSYASRVDGHRLAGAPGDTVVRAEMNACSKASRV